MHDWNFLHWHGGLTGFRRKKAQQSWASGVGWRLAKSNQCYIAKLRIRA